jgi:arginyl-tRNA synthetase
MKRRKELLKQIELFPEVIQNAAHNHSVVGKFHYDLVREYNCSTKQFYLRKKIQVKKYLEFSCLKVQIRLPHHLSYWYIAVRKECNMSALLAL